MLIAFEVAHSLKSLFSPHMSVKLVACASHIAPQRICLTFDAFGTLFHPRERIGKQYADVARQHGLSGFTDDEIDDGFRIGEYPDPVGRSSRAVMCLFSESFQEAAKGKATLWEEFWDDY